MKVRKVDTKKVIHASFIRSLIVTKLDVNPEKLLSGSREGNIPYARRLICYFVRNENLLQCNVIAEMVGLKKDHSLVSRNYKKIMVLAKNDDAVKADVQQISELINRRA